MTTTPESRIFSNEPSHEGTQLRELVPTPASAATVAIKKGNRSLKKSESSCLESSLSEHVCSDFEGFWCHAVAPSAR